MKLFELDTLMMGDGLGSLVEDNPWVFEWDDIHNIRTGDGSKDHFALEAWERQTTGGVQFGELGQAHVHRTWGHDTLGVSHGYQQAIRAAR